MSSTHESTARSIAASSSAPAGTSLSSGKPDDPEKVLREAAKIAEQNAQRFAQRTAARQLPIGREMNRVKPMDPEFLRRQEQAVEQAKRQTAVDACLRMAKVPERYRKASLTDLSLVPSDNVNAYRVAVQQLSRLQSMPATVAMIGTIGAGKTHLACALVNAFCLQARSARYMKALDYILAVRQSYSANAPRTQEQVEAEYIRFSLLVLDEMQVRAGSDNEEMLLLRLIDKRYEAGRATLMVSNHESKEAFHARIDSRVADRMADGGGCILCNWQSLRGRVNANR